MDPLKDRRNNQLLPVIVILVVAVGIGAASWLVASRALPTPTASGQPLDATQFAALLGKTPTTDEGCISCHSDRAALVADLERKPVDEPEKSTESEGEG